MKKKWMIMATVAFAVILFATVSVCAMQNQSPEKTVPISNESKKKLDHDERVAASQKEEEEAFAKLSREEQLEIAMNQNKPELVYSLANEAQKQALDRIENKGGIGRCKRESMIIMGLLPQNTARLTMQHVEQIYRTVIADSEGNIGRQVSAILTEFDKIAGAPDFIQGSGIGNYYYYLDDEGLESIVVNDLFVIIHLERDSEGKVIRKSTLFPSNPELEIND